MYIAKTFVHATDGLMCLGGIHAVQTKEHHHKQMARSGVYVVTIDIAAIAKFITFCYILPLITWDFN
jgi:hypothetical protein